MLITDKDNVLLQDIFPDKATERKILSLHIKCPSEGCEWTGELRDKEVLPSNSSDLIALFRGLNSFCTKGHFENVKVKHFAMCTRG